MGSFVGNNIVCFFSVHRSEGNEMAVNETAVAGENGGEAIFPGQSLREYLGLEVQHLLPGLEVAANLLRRGEHAQALQTYATLVLCEPSESRFQIGLAACALEIGEFHIASQAASAIVAFTPDDPVGYLLSGRALIGLQDFDAAVDDLRDAVRIAEAAGNTAVAAEAAQHLQRATIASEVKSAGA